MNAEHFKGGFCSMKQIACLFPGIGYTCDKPLLYYSWKLLSKQGWEIVPVQYSGFPSGVKGNPEKMQKAAKMALEQAEEILGDIHWNKYDQILFVAKSVGTVVSCAYAQRHQISCRSILFTPVEETFLFPAGDSIVFHGTADPWARTEVIRQACTAQGLPLYLTEKANHSLETGDLDSDLGELQKIMRIVKEYTEREG